MMPPAPAAVLRNPNKRMDHNEYRVNERDVYARVTSSFRSQPFDLHDCTNLFDFSFYVQDTPTEGLGCASIRSGVASLTEPDLK
jgi:hypothetical protein